MKFFYDMNALLYITLRIMYFLHFSQTIPHPGALELLHTLDRPWHITQQNLQQIRNTKHDRKWKTERLPFSKIYAHQTLKSCFLLLPYHSWCESYRKKNGLNWLCLTVKRNLWSGIYLILRAFIINILWVSAICPI